MKSSQTAPNVATPVGVHLQGRGFFQQRAHHFSLTMVVMGASFVLYYLGFFGGVDGPLQPERIGERMAAMGCNKGHVLIVFLLLTALAITWNWIYNAINRLLGRRLFCIYHDKEAARPCGLPVIRKKSQGKVMQYVCRDGHACGEAVFAPLKKGAVGHFMWMMCLVAAVIVYYHMG